MPTERDFDQRRTQRRADTREVIVISRNADNTFEADDTRTGQRLRFSPSRPTDNFAAGQHIEVTTPDASRNVIGGGYVALSTSPEQSRAVARYSRSALARYGSPVVSSLLPYPVRLPIGFATPREMVIRGFDLSQAPTYEHAGITNFSAPVITSLSITCQIVAAAGTPVGAYDVVVHGKTFVDALDCYEVPETLYVSGYVYRDYDGVNESDVFTISAINATTGLAQRTLQLITALNDYSYPTNSGLIRVGEAIYTLERGSASAPVTIVTASSDPDVPALVQSGDIAAAAVTYNHNLGWNGTQLVFASNGADQNLYRIDPDGANAVAVANLATDMTGVYWDGTYYWVCGANGLIRVTTSGTMTTLVILGSGIVGAGVVHSGSFLYVCDQGNARIRKVNISTVALDASLNIAGPVAVIVVGSTLYVCGATNLHQIDLATFTLTATLALGAGTYANGLALSRDASSIWIVDTGNGGRLLRVAISTFTIAQTIGPLTSLIASGFGAVGGIIAV